MPGDETLINFDYMSNELIIHSNRVNVCRNLLDNLNCDFEIIDIEQGLTGEILNLIIKLSMDELHKIDLQLFKSYVG